MRNISNKLSRKIYLGDIYIVYKEYKITIICINIIEYYLNIYINYSFVAFLVCFALILSLFKSQQLSVSIFKFYLP